MSSFALTALAGMSSSALDAALTMTTSQTGETEVRFGDGVHGAALPPESGSMPQVLYATGGGASGHAAAATPQPTGDQTLRHSTYGALGFAGEGGHLGGILMQQGRVQTDADYDEADAADGRRDEVSIAFEPGQMRRPFIVTPLWSSADKPPTSDGATHTKPADRHQGVPSRMDSMSEMGETESLRLQMAMDRLSKMMSTLSNILQRIETTDAAITQNIK